MSRVAVVGLGYVGLPLAVRAAEVGHAVVGLDTDESRLVSLRSGHSYINDVSDSRLQSVLGDGRLGLESRWPADAHGPGGTYDIGIIAVPTPMRGRVPDLTFVVAAGRLLGETLRQGATVVLESTTYPGTTEDLLCGVLHEASGLTPGDEFHVGFSPERIDPGNKQYTLETTPKLVSATTPEGLVAVQAFYDTIVETTVPVSSPRVAELTKLFENIQANVNIALINEVATICHELHIDVWEMIDASMTKGHSMAYWTPGPGVGGHCLPVDPLYLAWQAREVTGRPFRFAELADEVNKGRPLYVADRADELLRGRGTGLPGASVLVVGVAYKPGVADLRESPAIEVVRALEGRGASVTVVDPHVDAWDLTATVSLEELDCQLEKFSLVVVVTNHEDFDYASIGAQAQLVLDCRNAVPRGENVIQL